MTTANRSALLLALLVPLMAVANGNIPEPTPAPTPASSSSSSAADAAAISAAQARAAAESQAAAIAAQQQQQAMLANLRASGGDASASGGSVGDVEGGRGSGVGRVDVAGDSSSYNSRAYAIGLPALVGAPAVMADCLRHSRGGGVASAGVTGGTFYDKDCTAEVKRSQQQRECIVMADRLALWGRPDAAVAQLTKCGAIEVAPLPAIPPAVIVPPPAAAPDLTGFATKDDVARLSEKMDRIFTKAVGK